MASDWLSALQAFPSSGPYDYLCFGVKKVILCSKIVVTVCMSIDDMSMVQIYKMRALAATMAAC